MSKRSKKVVKAPKPKKPIQMPAPWKAGYSELQQRLMDYIQSGGKARGVPDGYAFNPKTGDFEPVTEPPKGG